VWSKFSEKGGKIEGGEVQKEAGMKGEALEQEWEELSKEVMEGVAKWREEHPRATMREIEAEIDERMSGLRAKMITDTANASARADWGAEEGVVCPKCGAKLMKKGKKKRVLLTRDGRKIELVRDYGVCVACGEGVFPPG
jgi:YgiT-type zinc finger domain-containing protein